MRPSKVIAKALSAGFHRMAQRVRPRPVGPGPPGGGQAVRPAVEQPARQPEVAHPGQHGLPRLWRRPDIVRGGPRREVLPRAELLGFSQLPDRSATTMAGLLLTIPDLLALDLPARWSPRPATPAPR